MALRSVALRSAAHAVLWLVLLVLHADIMSDRTLSFQFHSKRFPGFSGFTDPRQSHRPLRSDYPCSCVSRHRPGFPGSASSAAFAAGFPRHQCLPCLPCQSCRLQCCYCSASTVSTVTAVSLDFVQPAINKTPELNFSYTKVKRFGL